MMTSEFGHEIISSVVTLKDAGWYALEGGTLALMCYADALPQLDASRKIQLLGARICDPAYHDYRYQ
jgi:hypothetical protein